MHEDAYSPPARSPDPENSYHVVSGCSGSGKSSWLNELRRRGYETVPEPGRQIVKEQMRVGGDGVPWGNQRKFAELCISRSMYQFNIRRSGSRRVFFDRSIIDAVTYLEHIGELADHHLNAVDAYRYGRTVFMTPPWEEIYRSDSERRHAFREGVDEYENLLEGYERFGYDLVIVPRTTVTERADFIVRELNGSSRSCHAEPHEGR